MKNADLTTGLATGLTGVFGTGLLTLSVPVLQGLLANWSNKKLLKTRIKIIKTLKNPPDLSERVRERGLNLTAEESQKLEELKSKLSDFKIENGKIFINNREINNARELEEIVGRIKENWNTLKELPGLEGLGEKVKKADKYAKDFKNF